MTKKNKKIVLLLAGGTLLIDKEAGVLFVQKKEDIALWLKQMPELNILADVEPIFMAGEDDALTPLVWEKMAGVISAKVSQADGFVIVAKEEQLINTSLALAFLLQNFNKTIIGTSAQLSGTDFVGKKDIISRLKSKHGGLGLRSNLINAIQVANHHLPSPAIMFGSRLVPAVKAIKSRGDDINLFASADNNYWGRVDFGISLKSGLEYSSRPKKVYKKIGADVLLIEDMPGLAWRWEPELMKNYQAIIVKLSGNYKLETNKQDLLKKSGRPAVLYHFDLNYAMEPLVSLSGCTWSVAVLKTMWALANKKQLPAFDRAMQQNIIGEFTNT